MEGLGTTSFKVVVEFNVSLVDFESWYKPNSAICALFGFVHEGYFLQNSACGVLIWCLSHFANSWLVTSQP
jgi:hypothetical protein